MNCKEIEDKINRLKEKNGSILLTEEVNEHIKHCNSCKKYYEVSQHLNEFIRDRKSVDADDFFFSRVMSKLEENSNSIAPLPKKSFLQSYRSIAASVLILMALGLGILAGKYSANIYYHKTAASYQEDADVMGIQIADNSFNLINFEE